MTIQFREEMDVAPLGRLQWKIIALLVGVMVLDGMDLQLAAFCAPQLMKEWALDKPEFGPLLAAALIGMAAGTLLGSWAADRFGRKATLVFCVAYFGVMTMLTAAAGSATEFIAIRFFSGLGFGAAFPVATTMMGEWMPRRAVGKAISVMTIGIPLGGLLGAAAAAVLLPLLGWRVLFVLVGALSVLFSWVLFYRLEESPSYLILKGRHTQTHALMRKAWGRQMGNGSAEFSLDEPGVSGGKVLTHMNSRLNFGLWMAVLFSTIATYAVSGWLTLVFTGLNLPHAIALRGPMTYGMAAITGALIVGWLITRFGSKLTILALAFIAFVATAVLGMVIHVRPAEDLLFPIVFAGIVVIGVCHGALQPALYVIAAGGYSAAARSQGVGAAAGMGRLGAIVGSFVGGTVLAMVLEQGFFAMLSVLALLVAAGALVINRHIARIKKPAQQQVLSGANHSSS